MTVLPSPAPSPSMENMSRKRGRSDSHSSPNSASSPKRAVSEVPSTNSDAGFRSPVKTDSLAKLTIKPSDIDIDNYMAEQEQSTPGASASTSRIPPPPEKLAIIRALKNKEMIKGETWFVIQHSWYHRWETACSGGLGKESPVNESQIGPVDNSQIADNDGNIVGETIEGQGVDYVPQAAWEHFEQWYGRSDRPLPRRVITQGITEEPRLELYPIRCTFHILVAEDTLELSGPPAPRFSLSRKATVSQLLTELARLSNKSLDDNNIRYWLVQGSSSNANAPTSTSVTGLSFPVARLRQDRGKLFSMSETQKTLEDALVESGDAFIQETKLGSEWIFNETPIISRAVTPLFGSGAGQDFFSTKYQNAAAKKPLSTGRSDALTSKSHELGPPRTYSPHVKPPGTLGLMNLGNTCFMNSALQCLAHQNELTEYFLTGLFKEELNPDNPLGMQGAVAESFGALLGRIWARTSNTYTSAYSPREFKQTLARFAPSFSGYQQQDAQEFLAFLLDGLHEDLNRIIKKPYVEKPEWDGGTEIDLLQLAKRSWDGYMLRNDSVIVDLFQGQYQSTLVCPECSKVSITFDPFMYLTLPLPVHKKWRHAVNYVPWDLTKPHVSIQVELPVQATFKDLKDLIGRWMGASADNLLTLETWNSKLYRNLPNVLPIQELAAGDVLVCFELPCDSQQGKNFQRKAEDPIIVPVISMRQQIGPIRAFGLNSNQFFGHPFVIVVDPRKISSEEQIYEAVVERLARWTTHHRDLYRWQSGESSHAVDHIVPVQAVSDTITEFREGGEVVTVEEGDITEELSSQVMIPPEDMDTEPRRLGPKQDMFQLRLHASRGTSDGVSNADPLENQVSWEARKNAVARALANGSSEMITSPRPRTLIRPGDWLVCEWDVHMQGYYFGSEVEYEHATWKSFPKFTHPEYDAMKQADEAQRNRKLNLDDCLDEFTKEERLGEDDLWYCPKCKKHQQATKKFDIWKLPDVLVVHLKRFSSSRILRDKIDTFVDFPLEGLDLEARVGERQLLKQIYASGKQIDGLDALNEPLTYDLFSVTEHMGGLGGGHYRAFAKNDIDGEWYHFDDSSVYRTDAKKAVNQNAYLLFYRRQTATHLGGKTHEKIKEASGSIVVVDEPSTSTSGQLPTPPDDGSPPSISRRVQPLPSIDDTNANLPTVSDRLTPPLTGDDMAVDNRFPLSFANFDKFKRELPSETNSWHSSRSSNGAVGSTTSSVDAFSNLVHPNDGADALAELPVQSQESYPGRTEPHGDVDDIDI